MTWASDPAKGKVAHKYFASLNPMTARIMDAKSKVIHSYSKDDWRKMSISEQEAAFDKLFIPPDAVARYHYNSSSKSSTCLKVFPKLVLDTGQMLVKSLDDSKEKELWKDEHSDPFAWETRSQMNMALPQKQKKAKSSTVKGASSSSATISSNLQNGFKRKANGLSYLNKKPDDQSKGDSMKNELVQNLKADNQNDRLLTTEEVKVIVSQPKSTNQLPASSGENAPIPVTDEKSAASNKYSLPSKDVRRHVNHKPKPTNRINPRGSLTLDDEELIPIEDEAGAIHNLEVAMQEERVNQNNMWNGQKVAPAKLESPIKSKAFSQKPADTLLIKEGIDDSSKVELRHIDDSPVRDASPESSVITEEENSNTLVYKSGFDFLDNW